MPDNSEFETVDDNAEPGKLRQLLAKAHADLKQKDKELTELKTAETQRSVKSTWDELQVPDAIRKLYQGETTTEAIKAWWEDSKPLFNIQQAEETPVGQEPTPEQIAQVQAAQQFQEASAIGTTAAIQSGFDAIQAKVREAKGLKGADFEAAKNAIYEAMNTPKY